MPFSSKKVVKEFILALWLSEDVIITSTEAIELKQLLTGQMIKWHVIGIRVDTINYKMQIFISKMNVNLKFHLLRGCTRSVKNMMGHGWRSIYPSCIDDPRTTARWRVWVCLWKYVYNEYWKWENLEQHIGLNAKAQILLIKENTKQKMTDSTIIRRGAWECIVMTLWDKVIAVI